jgi:hypothetical protein
VARAAQAILAVLRVLEFERAQQLQNAPGRILKSLGFEGLRGGVLDLGVHYYSRVHCAQTPEKATVGV